MQSLDAFLPRLLPSVLGCSEPLAKTALVDSAIEFCESTLVVQAFSEPQPAPAGVGLYELDVPMQQAVASTLKVWFNQDLLTPAPASLVDAILAYITPVGTDEAVPGAPRHFYEVSPGVLGVYPPPQDAGYLSARCAFKPLRSATSLDDSLLEDWVDAVVSGACARLMIIPDQAFTEPKLAEYHMMRFKQEVAKAANLQIKGRVGASLRITGRPFA